MLPAPPEHADVLIVGAGLSGIGAACRLARHCPDRTVTILEGRDAIGGTWDLYRYPGVRSDSDMFTLSYPFRPWTGANRLGDGDAIRRYIVDTATEFGIRDQIRFRHRVLAASWSSQDAAWTVTAQRTDTGETVELTCSWLSICAGYYRYDQPHRPSFAGEDEFRGPIVHPQHWPEDLDWAGKRIVVIGSGATAVSLVPGLCQAGAQVTVVQRTPSYVISLPGRDPLVDRLQSRMSARRAYPFVWAKNLLVTTLIYQLSRRRPAAMKALVRKGQVALLPPGYDIDTHFTPPYEPWDQRLCLAPDGDLFTALASDQAAMVTERIDRFTADGVRLASGVELPADIIVTATGLTLQPVGGIAISVDGVPVDLADRVIYKGTMLGGVPNLNLVFGYTNGSWTLKADLLNRYLCRLLTVMARRGVQVATPAAPADGPATPFLDLTSGYVQRGVARLPKQGSRAPWRLYQNYFQDVALLLLKRVDDATIQFSRRQPARPELVTAA